MKNEVDFSNVPIVDVGDLVAGSPSGRAVADQLGRACRECGFFYAVGHGVDESLQARLRDLSREFFAKDIETKMRIRMALGGRAWRGYFSVGDELTSGKPDQKEGMYFGEERPADDPLVLAGTPWFGPNLFPAESDGFKETVLSYMAELTGLGHRLMTGLALSLGLNESYFADRCMGEPLTLFRIVNYPPPSDPNSWGVGEHTDYGLLTILLQDQVGGLEVKSRSRWIPAPPVPGSFDCNIGDMLDRVTGGLFRSTRHRVRNPAQRDRLSFPFFFDPNFFAQVRPIEGVADPLSHDDRDERWDRASVHAFEGTYGNYLLNKIGKVFPALRSEVI